MKSFSKSDQVLHKTDLLVPFQNKCQKVQYTPEKNTRVEVLQRQQLLLDKDLFCINNLDNSSLNLKPCVGVDSSECANQSLIKTNGVLATCCFWLYGHSCIGTKDPLRPQGHSNGTVLCVISMQRYTQAELHSL